MAFNRVVEVDIGQDGTGLRVSGLDLSFRVNRSRMFLDHTAELTIYNPSPETRAYLQREGNNIYIRAGYADQDQEEDGTVKPGVIFAGQVLRAVDHKEGTTRRVDLFAATIRNPNAPLTKTYVSLSYTDGADVGQIVRELGELMGLVVNGAENASGIVLDGAWVASGTWREAVRSIERVLRGHGVGLYVDIAEIVLYKFEGTSDYTAAYLTYDNGLLRVEDVTEAWRPDELDKDGKPKPIPKKRIRFASLLNWRIRPNSLVRIHTHDINGVYLVESLTFTGDNFGGEFSVEGEGTV